jgi:hypothetical protein
MGSFDGTRSLVREAVDSDSLSVGYTSPITGIEIGLARAQSTVEHLPIQLVATREK